MAIASSAQNSANSFRTYAPNKALALRQRVYEYLKELLNKGTLTPGTFLDLKSMEQALGISRTPLRDALIRLEAEGFVVIHPRRGVLVAVLDLEAIRNSYQIIGALESAAILEGAERLRKAELRKMTELDEAMRQALDDDDFSRYHECNLAFHDVYLTAGANAELRKLVGIRKERLYDFPRRQGYLRSWELSSVGEHAELLRLLKRNEIAEAAAFVRNVHWSFEVQERFIREYYFARIAGQSAGVDA